MLCIINNASQRDVHNQLFTLKLGEKKITKTHSGDDDVFYSLFEEHTLWTACNRPACAVQEYLSVRLHIWLLMTQTTHQFKSRHSWKERKSKRRNVMPDCAPTEESLKCLFSSSQIFFSDSACPEQTSDHFPFFLPQYIMGWWCRFKICHFILWINLDLMFQITMLSHLQNHKLFTEN